MRVLVVSFFSFLLLMLDLDSKQGDSLLVDLVCETVDIFGVLRRVSMMVRGRGEG